MNVESLIFRKLTPNEFKAITNTINSQGGGSQTYIDFPKGCISDDDFKEFFESEGNKNTNGFEWILCVIKRMMQNGAELMQMLKL